MDAANVWDLLQTLALIAMGIAQVIHYSHDR